MHPFLSPFVAALYDKPRATQISSLVLEKKRQGADIVNLLLGEPDFNTPAHIQEAVTRAMQEGKTRYTAVPGIYELRQAIAHKLLQDNQLQYQPQQIIVTAGAKQALSYISCALLSVGDEVVMPVPAWNSYAQMILLFGGVPVMVSTSVENNYHMTAEQLEAAITPRTRFILFNNPCNPTGAAYSAEELLSFAEVLRRHPHVFFVSDDIYEKIIFHGNTFCSLLNVAPDLKDRVVLVNGVSKAYAMTGFRLGYIACTDPDLLQGLDLLHSQFMTSSPSVSQYSALAALTGPQDSVQQMCAVFERRADYLYHALCDIPSLHLCRPEGAFYLFFSAARAIEHLYQQQCLPEPTSHALCHYLLEEHHLAVLPGAMFHEEGAVRVSFAASDQELQRFVEICQQVFVF